MRKQIIITLIFLIFISLASSQELLILTYEDTQLNIISINPMIKNNYYRSYYNGYKEETDYVFRFTKGNDVLEVSPDNKIYTLLDYNLVSDFEYLEVIKDNEIISFHNLSFCNYNGICEPCLLPDCDTQENELVCSDCEQSSKDNFCNIKDDGICDPDCTAYEYDQPGEYEECFEENLKLVSCSNYSGKICTETQVCEGDWLSLDISGELCCLGECVESEDTYLFDKTCSNFFWNTCSEDEVCDGEEIYLNHAGVACCTGNCYSTLIDYGDPKKDETKNDNTALVIISLIIISAALLVVIIAKKKLVKVSFFIFLIASGAVLFFSLQEKSQITGMVVSPASQAGMICEIAESYNLPTSYLLAIAYKESGINHYRSDGSVKISGDCGVGITQQQYFPIQNCDALRSGRTKFICGTSLIDGRQLDTMNLKDNIECGALELIKKCTSLNCINNQKLYSCPNTDNPLPAKNVIYKNWDIAIRAYNGWGCMSYYYRDLWGATDPRYINLISRIQSYVEDFKAVEKQFQGYCDNYKPGDPIEDENKPIIFPVLNDSESITLVPEEIKTGEKIGFYYLNPSFRVISPDLSKIHTELSFSSTLVKEALSCNKQGNSFEYCITQSINNNQKSSWKLDGVDEEQAIAMFSVDTGVIIKQHEKNNAEKPLILKIALTITEKGTQEFQGLVAFSETGKPLDSEEKEEEKQELDGKTIVFYGDSITDNDFQAYTYAHIVQQHIKENNKNINIEIMGNPAQPSRYGATRIYEVISKNPDIVCMLWGMNDIYGNTDDIGSQEFRNLVANHIYNLRYQAETLKQNEIVPVIMTVTISYENFNNQPYNEKLEFIAEEQRKLAKEMGIKLIDTRKAMQSSSGVLADAAHPNSKGYALMAQEIIKELGI